MPKRKFELVSIPQEPIDEGQLEWNSCFLCQKVTNEKLILPGNSKCKDKVIGYKTLAEDLKRLSDISSLPFPVGFGLHGRTLEDVLSLLVNNEAKFHKSCRNKCDKQHYERAVKRKSTEMASQAEKGMGTRSSYESPNFLKATCFFCEQEEEEENLRNASTLKLDSRVRSAALALSDDKILAKLSEGDMIGTEAKYHYQCLCSYYARAREKNGKNEADSDESPITYGIVLSEVINFMKKKIEQNSTAPIFKLSDIKKMFSQRYEHYTKKAIDVHSSRLKDQLLLHVEGLKASRKGKEVLLSSEDVTGDALYDACVRSSEDDGICLAKAAKIIRREILKSKYSFKGRFDVESQKECVPSSLIHLVRMILEGTDISAEFDENTNVAALSVAQLVKFNCIKKARQADVHFVRHGKDKETPLPVYLGVMLLAMTGKRGVVDKIAKLGLSVTSQRVDEIETAITKQVCEDFNATNLVRPASLLDQVFTTAAIDNIDHNATSTFAAQHFHGTSISLFQHVGEEVNFRAKPFDLQSTCKERVKGLSLPDNYTNICPASQQKSEVPLPCINTIEGEIRYDAISASQDWLDSVTNDKVSEEDTGKKDGRISWSAFHQDRMTDATKPNCQSILLPLLKESINSPAMVTHCLKSNQSNSSQSKS